MTVDDGRALALAYRHINSRERTVAEVRARLQRAELPEGEITAAIDELLELGYLDDTRYARVFTQDKRMLEAWGNERIERVLRERGIDREVILTALDEGDHARHASGLIANGPIAGGPFAGGPFAGGPIDGTLAEGMDGVATEADRAVALLVRRFPAGPAEARDRERAFRVLARKGYDSETAGDAVREWARRASPAGHR
jgi:regulatory protein